LPTSKLLTVLGFLNLQGMVDLLFNVTNVTAISWLKFSSIGQQN